MNTSPVTEWEGTEAYFTFADSPTMLGIILLLSVAVTIGCIVISSKHETESAKKLIVD